MEQAQISEKTKEIKNKEKKFSITSNKNNIYEIRLINEISYLLIKASYNNMIQILQFEEKFPLEQIKKNPFFGYFESIDEILDELFPLIDNKKFNLIEENKEVILIIQLPVHKIKEIKFPLKQTEKNDKDKFNELYDIIKNLKEENNNLKKRVDNNENLIKELIKRIEYLEGKEKEREKEKEKEKEKIKEQELRRKTFNSNIIISHENFEFINNLISNREPFKNKKIKYDLLYRASRDGDDASKFHEKCDNKNQVLVIFKTTKELIFGGYTQIGYKGKGGNILDNNAFFFSCNLKKIYNVKKDKTAILDNPTCGPTFGNNTTIICVANKMFDYNCCTCSVNASCFDGISSDYEINAGEQSFRLQEIEVFQITIQ